MKTVHSCYDPAVAAVRGKKKIESFDIPNALLRCAENICHEQKESRDRCRSVAKTGLDTVL